MKTYNFCCCSCFPGSAQDDHGLLRWLQKVDDPGLRNRISKCFSKIDIDEETVYLTRMLSWNLFPSRRKNMKFIFWW